MANWYTTEFRITGSQADRDAAMALLKELPKDKDGTLPLDELAQALGCDAEKTFCRGYITDFGEREEHIELYTETANQPPYQVIFALCRKFPSLKYYFQVEMQDEILTNDADGKFFKRLISVYLSVDDDYINDQFSDEEDAKSWINRTLGRSFVSLEDADSCPDCHVLCPRVIGEDEQLTILPRPDGEGLDLYTLDGTHAGTVTIGKN